MKAFLPLPPPPHAPAEAHNRWAFGAEATCSGILTGITSIYLIAFFVRLETPTPVLGWITAAPAIAGTFLSIPAARFIRTRSNALVTAIKSSLLLRLGYIIFALFPWFLPSPYLLPTLTAIALLLAIPTVITNLAMTTLLAEAITPDKRASVISVCQALTTFASIVSLFLGGWALGHIPFPSGYQILFIASGSISMLSLLALRHIHIPERPLRPSTKHPRPFTWAQIKATLRTVTSPTKFWRYTLGLFLFGWGLYFPSALYTPFRVRVLNASDLWLGALSAVANAATIIAAIYWGRRYGRKDHRTLLLIGIAGLTPYPLIHTIVPRLPLLIPLVIWGGWFSAIYNIASTSGLLAYTPEEERESFLAIHTTLLNLTAFLAPILGTTLASHTTLRHAMAFSSILRLLGLIATFIIIPRPTPPQSPSSQARKPPGRRHGPCQPTTQRS